MRFKNSGNCNFSKSLHEGGLTRKGRGIEGGSIYIVSVPHHGNLVVFDRIVFGSVIIRNT